MSRVPRLLPMIAVAIGGVLALKAVATFQGAPSFLQGAKARAEAPVAGDAKKAAAAKKAKAAPAAAAPAPDPSAPPPPPPGLSSPVPPAEAAKASAPVCAPNAAELAKEAGLSPAELRVLQSLQVRRGQLDQREQAMQTELALLAAAEGKVDSKIKAFNELKAQVQGLMGEADQKQAAEVTRLVKVYSDMKDKDAAAVMVQLDDKVRVPVAAGMKERTLAAILAKMPPADAKKLTEKLAGRFTPTASMTQAAADQPAPAPSTGASPPRKKAAKAAAPAGA